MTLAESPSQAGEGIFSSDHACQSQRPRGPPQELFVTSGLDF